MSQTVQTIYIVRLIVSVTVRGEIELVTVMDFTHKSTCPDSEEETTSLNLESVVGVARSSRIKGIFGTSDNETDPMGSPFPRISAFFVLRTEHVQNLPSDQWLNERRRKK